MENKNLNILDEVNKGATMGMDAISYVSEKVVDNDFKEVLNTEYNKYKDISNRVNNLYDKVKFLRSSSFSPEADFSMNLTSGVSISNLSRTAYFFSPEWKGIVRVKLFFFSSAIEL